MLGHQPLNCNVTYICVHLVNLYLFLLENIHQNRADEYQTGNNLLPVRLQADIGESRL